MKNVHLLLFIFAFSMHGISQSKLNDSLYSAVLKNDSTLINYYCQKGADVNKVFEINWVKVNLLIIAVNQNNLQSVKTLISNGADVNWVDGFNTSALMYAVGSNNIKITELLLQNGADLSHHDDEGNNALSIATAEKNSKIISLLKQKKHEE